MKRFILLFIVFITILSFSISSNKVSADMGPKPSIVITFENVEFEKYYVTLFSKTMSTGPYTSIKQFDDVDDIDEIDNSFIEYEKTNDYYYLLYYQDCSNTNTFKWGYYPPSEFKVLIYIPSQERFIESEVLSRYAFDSYYKVDCTNLDEVEITTINSEALCTNYNYLSEIITFLIRFLLTFLVEVLIAFIFIKMDKKIITTLLIVNFITQLILNIILSISLYRDGSLYFIFIYIVSEIVVIGVELITYLIISDMSKYKINPWKIVGYVFISNIVSFFVGLLISNYIPILF